MGNPIKILAMDGGNGMNTADLLLRLETSTGNSFLDATDIFVGTSAGGINSLFFAFEPNPAKALADLQAFWMNVNKSILEGIDGDGAAMNAVAAAQIHPGNPQVGRDPGDIAGMIFGAMLGLGGAALGLRPLFVNDVLKQFLIQHFGANTTLGDLKHYVVVVSFQLDNKPGSTTADIDRSWVPRLYTNLPYTPPGDKGALKSVSSPDMYEKVVDVALRTSAAPVELPIYQSMNGGGPYQSGFVDGGLVANNPAMIALAAIVGTLAHGTTSQPPQPPTQSLSEIHILSIGTGRNLVGTAQYLDPEYSGGSAQWGYRNWLFDPANPFVLVDAFLQGGNEAVAWQCNILLGPQNFHRLNVPLQHMLVPSDPATAALVARAATWINTSGWMVKPPLRSLAML